MSEKRILVTGATGKVGREFIATFLANKQYEQFIIRALIHNRRLPEHPRLEMMQGSIEDESTVNQAMDGVTHVLHLATCKEIPSQVMDVTVKGLFWLLEACRKSATFEQFILIGGDAAIGHFHYPHPIPVTEQQDHSAYAGCYALSKVLEEVMLEQYYVQYNLNGCCLRAPWIMEKDDFRWHLSFSPNVFGAPRWCDFFDTEQAQAYMQANTIPIMLDNDNKPIKRNFVHVKDLVMAILSAIDNSASHQETFNICMNEPIDYQQVGDYLADKYGFPTVAIKTNYHSTWLDNSKAKFLLGWRPDYEYTKLIDESWSYQRSNDDPRTIWYPG